jgi:hypothetical protein
MRILWVVVAFWVTLSPATSAAFGDISNESLYASFITNIIKYSSFPNLQTEDAPLVVALSGPESLIKTVTSALDGATLRHRKVQVRIFHKLPPAGANVVFVGQQNEGYERDLIASCSSVKALCISDSPAFAALGGAVQIAVKDGRIRFRINREGIHPLQIELSSRVMVLADDVLN